VTASTGGEKVELKDILIGDVWVMYGQSNMAWGLQKTSGSDLARLQANIPMLRHFRIKTNEQPALQTDIRTEAVIDDGWEVSTPETTLEFSAIGSHFGSRLERALGIPIGLVSAARGGASIESMVPAHKFSEHPLAANAFLRWRPLHP
jgi:sialate O-acetylesterase